MGYASTLSSLIFFCIILVLFSTLLSIEDMVIRNVDSALSTYRYIEEFKLDEKIQIVNGFINSSGIFLNVTNIGSSSIPVAKFNYIDLIVVFRSLDNSLIVKRVSYDYSSSDRWEITRVFVGNKLGEIINPILTTSGTGLWDPFETLEIRISLSSLPPYGEPVHILFSTPHGVIATYLASWR